MGVKFAAIAPPPGHAVRAPRIRGAAALPPGCDPARLLPHVLADLRGRGCEADLLPDGVLVVRSGSGRRGSVLGFVTDGVVWVAPDRTLQYGFSLRGGLALCLCLAPVAAGLGWFALDSPALALFGLLAPVVWLYGANHVLAAVRVPAHMERLCRTAPGALPARRVGV